MVVVICNVEQVIGDGVKVLKDFEIGNIVVVCKSIVVVCVLKVGEIIGLVDIIVKWLGVGWVLIEYWLLVGMLVLCMFELDDFVQFCGFVGMFLSDDFCGQDVVIIEFIVMSVLLFIVMWFWMWLLSLMKQFVLIIVFLLIMVFGDRWE